MNVKPIPDGYHTITPYLVTTDAAALLNFLTAAFDARESERMLGPDGAIAHAEVRIGDSPLMIGQTRGDRQPVHGMLYLYVHDCDATYQRALSAGATSIVQPTNQFYGDRNAGVMDPFGNQWWVATRVENVPADELKRRAAAKK